MLNMKKTLLTTAILTMMATAAFAAPADAAPQSVTMKERTNAILHADHYQKDKKMAEKALSKLSAKEKAEVEKFIKEDMKLRGERRELNKKLAGMNKEQKIAIRAKIRMQMPYKEGVRFDQHKKHNKKHFECKPMHKHHHGKPAPQHVEK